MKSNTGQARLNMSTMFGQLQLSSRTAKRITSTFTPLKPEDHEGRDALAAEWVSRLKSCKTEMEVRTMLDGMGL